MKAGKRRYKHFSHSARLYQSQLEFQNRNKARNWCNSTSNGTILDILEFVILITPSSQDKIQRLSSKKNQWLLPKMIDVSANSKGNLKLAIISTMPWDNIPSQQLTMGFGGEGLAKREDDMCRDGCPCRSDITAMAALSFHLPHLSIFKSPCPAEGWRRLISKMKQWWWAREGSAERNTEGPFSQPLRMYVCFIHTFTFIVI